ncbi:hypothetical protein [Peribacillus simplex]|uniref:Uncharacterized protein n=1 Tax=Peribacillus simplex NBRC 15720 = DSM 1321 TaxID=1349754 RepID=A0A223EP10_9BACI|nr:hypothetical protein [Peribacillus simplex]ASS96966.1 hypothetical protein BS1321_25530 [Peribacillus simplex NBRC 15720 = DSM 1321]MEC1398697.1 hypothetical protein [Peribacillus simplex]
MTFLKGIGEDTSDLERTTQLPENQYLHKANETADIERPTSRKSYGSSIPSKSGIEKKRNISWFWIAAGVSLVTIPLTLSKSKK